MTTARFRLARFLRDGLAALGLGLAGGTLMAGLAALRLIQIEQALNPRAMAVIGVLAGGGALSGFLVRLLAAPLLGRLPWLVTFGLAAPTLGILAMGGGASLFAIIMHDLGAVGEPTMDGPGGLHEFLFGHGSTAYLMLLAGWPVMFPWLVPILSVVTAILVAAGGARRDADAFGPDAAGSDARLAFALRRDS